MRDTRRRTTARRITIFLATALLVAVAAVPAVGGTVPSSAPDAVGYVTDGPVYAVERAGGRTYIGGQFEHVGPRVGSGVPLSQADGSLATGTAPGDPAFPEVAGGEVRAVVSDGHGGWYIGGDFTHVARQSFARLAHIAGGQLDTSWNPAPNGTVRALAIGNTGQPSSSTLYVGGSFSNVGGENRTNAAAFKLSPASGAPVSPGNKSDGTALASRVPADWKPEPDGTVHALTAVTINDILVTQDAVTTSTDMTILIAGGDFTKLGTNDPPDRLVGIWGLGATDRSGVAFANPAINLTGTAPNATVRALAAGPTVQFDPAQADDNANVPIYFAGDFTGTSPKNGLAAARLQVRYKGAPANPTLTVYTNWAPIGANIGTVNALALAPPIGDQQTLYFGGNFNGEIGVTGATQPRQSVAAVSGIPLTPAVVSANSCPTSGANSCPHTVQPWNPTLGVSTVNALTLSGSTAYVGGNFESMGPSARNGLAAVTASNGEALPEWDARPAGGPTHALAVQGSSVFAGGAFESVGATPRRNLAAIGSDGHLDGSWNPGADNRVEALAADGGTLYVGGQFVTLGGQERARLGAVDAATGQALDGFSPTITCLKNGNPCVARPSVFTIEPTGPTVYIGGAFTHVNGQERRGLAAVNPIGAVSPGEPTGWDPDATGPLGGSASEAAHVHDIEASCEAVYAAGNFSRIGVGQPTRTALAALDPASGEATGWNPNPNSAVFDLALRGGTVYAAGNFATIGSASGRAGRQRLAALRADGVGDGSGPVVTGWNPGADGVTQALALSGDGTTLYAGGEFNQLGGASRAGLGGVDAVTAGDGSGDATGFNPGPAGGFASSRETRTIDTSGDNVYAGGEFTRVGTAAQAGFSSHTVEADPAETSLDCSLPTVAIVSGPSGAVRETSATFEFVASDPTAETECSLDGAAFVPCTSPASYSDLAAGEHGFAVRARRPGSRFVGPEAVAIWTIDPNLPDPNADPEEGCPAQIVGDDGKNKLKGTKRDDGFQALGGADTVLGKAGSDCIDAGAGKDKAEGDKGDDRLFGRGAMDKLLGQKGDDRIAGGPGEDVVKGGAGDDRLGGEAGADKVSGGAGNDLIDGGAGEDRLRGGPRKDRLRAADGVRDVVNCGGGRDVAILDRADKAKGCERKRRVKD